MTLERRISNLERNASMAVGDPLMYYVNNRTGSTLDKGTAVYISGSQGNRITVAKAQANAESTSSKTFGVTNESIANNQSGWVTVAGSITKIDTSAFTEGNTLYLSPTTAGAFTATKPAAPSHLVYVGFVTRAHATVGAIYVKVQNGYELDEIHDVQITSPANGDRLNYDSASGLWKNIHVSRIELKNTTSTQSLTNGTAVTIGASATASNQWTTVENLGSMFTLGTTTGLVTTNTAGRVSIYGKIRLDTNTTGQRILQVVLNGSEQIAALTVSGNSATSISVSVPSFRLSANDTLELRVYQDSGGARTLATGSTIPLYFIVEYLGA